MKPRITINGIVILLLFLVFSTTLYSQTTIPDLEVRNSSGGSAITSGDANVVLQPYFYVVNNDATYAAECTVEVATDQFFGNVVATQIHSAVGATLNSEIQLASALSINTTYYVRANAANTNGDGDSPWTSIIQFSTTVVDGAPSLAWPTGGVDVYSVDVDLSYYANGQVVQYEVAWGTVSSMPDDTTPVPGNLGGNTFVAFGTIGTDLTYSLTGLTPGVTYYWYVRYTDDGTNYSPWSVEGDFTVSASIGAVTPTPSWPIGGALVYTDLPTLYWYTASTSASLTYEVVWSLESDNYVPDAGAWGTPTHSVGTPYTADFMALSGSITGSSYTLAGSEALAGDTYDWYIRSSNDGGTTVSAWSTVETFEVYNTAAAGLTVLPTYPTGGAIVYTNSPTLYWYTVGADPSYQYQVYVVTDGGTAPASDATTQNLDGSGDNTAPSPIGASMPNAYLETGITNLFAAISGCVSSTDYDWYVRIFDPASLGGTPDYSPWTAVSDFSTDAASGTAVVPVLIYPANGELVYTTTPTLSWSAYSTATLEFELVVTAHATDTPDNGTVWNTITWSGGGSTEVTEDGISTTSHILGTAISGTGDYRWFVRSRVGTGTPSDWSAAGAFEISASSPDVLQKAFLLTPVAGMSVNDRTPTFTWSEPSSLSSITYEIEVNLYSDFRVAGDFVLGGAQTGLTSTSFTGSNDLALGTTYYWRITSSHGSFTDQVSDTAEFFVLVGATLVVPIPGNPIANAAVSSSTPEVSWFLPVPEDEAVSYDVEFSKTIDFASPVVYSGLTESKMVVEGLETGKQYFWRVKSKSSSGESGYSITEAFRTPSDVTGVEDNFVPLTFEVSQNYPNPFNPSTNIKFSLPEASFVTVRIFNMLGQEVKTLINRQTNAGVYNVTWNGTDNQNSKVSTGTYIYRVIAGENIITKKMVLLK